MSHKLGKMLAPDGCLGANGAMGIYLYEGDDELPLGRKDDEFKTSCIVETTLGDRRFGTHVYAGLMLLLGQLIDADTMDEGAVEKLTGNFPAARCEEFCDLGPLGFVMKNEENPVCVVNISVYI